MGWGTEIENPRGRIEVRRDPMISSGSISTRTTKIFFGALVLAAVVAFAPAMAAQANATGPMAEPPPRDVVNIPIHPQPEPAAIPPAEIIKRFAAKEDAFAQASRSFGYRKSIVVQEMGPNGKPSGQVEVITAPFYGSDGKRYERVVSVPATPAPTASTANPDQVAAPPTTGDLHALHFEPEDVVALALMPQFPFTTDQLAKYNITYQGKQRVDELNTYVFAMEPKQVDRQHAYFSGVVWVDDQELAIVKSYGKWVTELGDVTSPKLPFTLFETYRQQVGDSWFPAYSRSDDQVTTKDDVIPVRLIIKWTDYAPVPVPPPASAAGNAPSH
jgi:hypothetical protein